MRFCRSGVQAMHLARSIHLSVPISGFRQTLHHREGA